MRVRIDPLQKGIIKIRKGDPKLSDNRIKDPDKKNNDLNLSLPSLKYVNEFKERLEKLEKLYVRETRRLQIQIELS